MKSSNFEPITHDGRHDLLTNLMAPPHYYEAIARELALLKRSYIEICVIRIVIPTNSSDEEITNFADALSKSVRTEDLAARVGKVEFGLLVRGNQSLVEKFMTRLDVQVEVNYASTQVCTSEATLELLNRLDKLQLSIFKPTYFDL